MNASKVILVLALVFFSSRVVLSKNVYYFFDFHYFTSAPDGVTVNHTLGVNGKFPGPTIEATEGDILHIIVQNNIQTGANTTLHCHGIFQSETPFQDGPDMVTQCPIPNGDFQTYVFPLKQHGTYWWHSHFSYQLTEGNWGALIVHAKNEVYAKDYDDEFTITLSDWSHTSGQTNIDWFLSPASGGNEPIPNSVLLNGRGSFPCSATRRPCDPRKQVPKVFRVTRGKRYRIRVINTSAMARFFFSIPDHILNVIETDGVDTVKVPLNRVPIAAAQRYSFIVEMNGQLDEYWIVAEVDMGMYNTDSPNINSKPEALIPIVQAKLQYCKQLDCESLTNLLCPIDKRPIAPNRPYVQPKGDFQKQMLLQPYDKILAPNTFHQEITLDVNGLVDDAGVNHLTFNDIVYEIGDVPILGLVLQNKTVPASANSFTTGHNKVVQIVISNRDTGPHPFHLHGHAFYVVGIGKTNAGDYNSTSDTLVLNGVKRDTIVVNTASWVVLRFITNNPGVWFLHCHINWHLQSGLAAVIIEAPEVARNKLTIPREAKRICKANRIKL